MPVKIPKIIQLLYPSITWTKQTSANEIWLTFDDGPDPTRKRYCNKSYS